MNISHTVLPANRFITFFATDLDPISGELTYINAGHNPPMVARTDGSIEKLESGGFPLGIMPTAEFELGKTHLAQGEGLVIFSDGVSEAVDPEGGRVRRRKTY